MWSNIVYYAPLVLAPFMLVVFAMISAYVFKFRLPRSGLGFDYMIFAIVVAITLYAGGVI